MEPACPQFSIHVSPPVTILFKYHYPYRGIAAEKSKRLLCVWLCFESKVLNSHMRHTFWNNMLFVMISYIAKFSALICSITPVTTTRISTGSLWMIRHRRLTIMTSWLKIWQGKTYMTLHSRTLNFLDDPRIFYINPF